MWFTAQICPAERFHSGLLHMEKQLQTLKKKINRRHADLWVICFFRLQDDLPTLNHILCTVSLRPDGCQAHSSLKPPGFSDTEARQGGNCHWNHASCFSVFLCQLFSFSLPSRSLQVSWPCLRAGTSALGPQKRFEPGLECIIMSPIGQSMSSPGKCLGAFTFGNNTPDCL